MLNNVTINRCTKPAADIEMDDIILNQSYPEYQQPQQQQQHQLSKGLADAAHRLQRKQRLEALVIKRKQNVSYICKIHNGSSYWLNCTLMTSKDLQRHVLANVSKQRTIMFYYLGLSVSKLLFDKVQAAGIHMVKAFSQLLEEWEYYYSNPTMQNLKFVLAKNSQCIYPQYSIHTDSDHHHSSSSGGSGSSDHSIPKANIHKFNGSIVFEYLLAPPVPFELDYIDVLCALCDSVSSLYDTFLHEDCYR